MTALASFRTAIDRHGVHEIDGSYIEAVREYHSNNARRMREDWLLQQQSALVRRINLIRAKQRYAVEESLCPITLALQLDIETCALAERREELRKLRSES